MSELKEEIKLEDDYETMIQKAREAEPIQLLDTCKVYS